MLTRKFWQILTLTGIASISLSGFAHAYLDPGNGGILMQAILGTCAAIAVGLKFYWEQFMAFFRKPKK